jgi:hypothetical protein
MPLAASKQVRELELTAEDLEQVMGGWSVSALSQMGGGGSKGGGNSGGGGISLTFDKIQIEYSRHIAANDVCEFRQIVQAIFCRRRHHARSTPPANTKPGSPAPAMGPGTEA